jgi:hypothetical protein
MYIIRKSFVVLLLVGILLASCGGQEPTATPTSEIDAILTAGVGTLAASIFQTQTALVPPATETPSPTVISTNTLSSAITLPPLSTSTAAFFTPVVILGSPTPTGTQYTPTVNSASLAYGCNNLLFISDASYPAGSVLNPGEKFTKEWQVANSGTCDWVYLYRLVFVSGEKMKGGPSSLGKVIVPGKWTTLRVDLVAPSAPGTYTGYWRFGDQSGNMFGSTLGVSIVVSSPTNTPKPPTPVPPTVTSTATPTETPSATPTQ